ncbi:AfsR/SARP family transcriptional regulator [Goodfellowiella coeruleoviolacea]|uniref:AfsR/SARP family transcriptional regulator n=1 Tax=Goodfellowiella coeruleoviolacea TaxID=334858 RepID=UPI0027E0DA69|nr:BTAD domain-containing putative transcriptional regulator [Goodfellowiella coeruleoviolacea]
MTFELLGDIQAHVAGEPIDLGHARQRSVLAALLVEPNRSLPLDLLIERVWGDRAPRQARNTLYGYLYRLRQAFAGVAGVRIDRTPGGYLLPVDEHAVDLHRFRLVVKRAQAEPDEQALDSLERALALWRGQALGGADGPWAQSVRRALDQERWTALLQRNDIALRLGRHTALLAELSALADENPLDERLAGQLILALYQCGRQGDALTHYQSVRRRLAEELGADPGPGLRELHQRVLAGELTAPATARIGTPTPRQLPAAPRLFVGRTDELARIDKVLASGHAPPPVLAVVGSGGTGKTALVLHWAHRAVDRFPDGQLHADLRGFDPAGPPVSPAAVVRGFLDALGVPADSAPADQDGQVALYRSLLAGKRLLVVLDNARDTDQVLPLLPGSPTCTVLVTSRQRLTGLAATHGVPTLALDVLTDAEARDLLVGHLGEQRVRGEPGAVAHLLRWCAGLPLAVGIVAARAAVYPDFPLSALVEELSEDSGLDALDTGELSTSLRAVFAASYRALPPEAAEAFALLGVAPGPDIGVPAAAALLGVPVPRLRGLVRHLETGHLVRQHVPGRYRMHDLVRVYAVERARADHADSAEAGLRRVIDFYVRFGRAAERVLYPYETPPAVGEPAGAVPDLPDDTAALAWLTAEYAGVLAAQQAAARRGWHPPVWQLAWALDTFQRRQGHLQQDQLAAWRAGLAAAERAGDAAACALAAWRLGAALARVGDLGGAADHLDLALAQSRASGDASGQANAHQSLAWVCEQRGEDTRALHHATSALEILRGLGVPMREAHALNQAGWYAARLNDLDRAARYCEAALELARRHGDRDAEARTLDSLGYLAHRAGRHDHAVERYEQALVGFVEVGATYDYVDTLQRLGDSHAAAGRGEQARAAWRTALSLLDEQHRTADAEQLRAKLARRR